MSIFSVPLFLLAQLFAQPTQLSELKVCLPISRFVRPLIYHNWENQLYLFSSTHCRLHKIKTVDRITDKMVIHAKSKQIFNSKKCLISLHIWGFFQHLSFIINF